jgi:CRP/FNR family transcriptional regulator, cyclic AMP receptor protein
VTRQSLARRYAESLVGLQRSTDSRSAERAWAGHGLWHRYWTSLLGFRLHREQTATREPAPSAGHLGTLTSLGDLPNTDPPAGLAPVKSQSPEPADRAQKAPAGFWGLLARDERDALWDLGIRRDYAPGARILLEGDPSTHVFVLLEGWVKVLSTTGQGGEIVLALRGDGDIVGEHAGPAGRRNATVQAVDTVRALIVRYDKFTSFLDSSPSAGRAYRRVVTQTWSDSDAILRRRADTTGAQRLAALLLDLTERYGSKTYDAVDLTIPLSQDELASLADTSRATVTRALSNWKRRGFISTGQRRITIIDLRGLRQIAGH